MKTSIFKIMAAGLLTLSVASCGDDFLDVSSKTESQRDNSYRTMNDAQYALIGCYDGWQRTVSNGPTFSFQYLSEILSDDCYGGTGNSDARNTQLIDRMSMNEASSELNLFNDLWGYYYAAIYRCNEFLQHMDGIDWTDEATRNTYEGETRAIRALCYFDLVRMFENIPLLTRPSEDNVPQAAPDSVYHQIIEDFKFAANNIPEDAYPKANAEQNDGHITCYAAKALLARVYLFYSGVYGKEPKDLTKAEVLQGLEDIIESKQYSLVRHFKDLWKPASTSFEGDDTRGYTEVSTYAGDGNSETILAMKFNYTSDYNGNGGGNNTIVMFGLRGGIFKAPYGQGWGGCTVNRQFYNLFTSGDTRRDASIINVASEGLTSIDAFNSALSDQREYTGFYIKKYTPMSAYVQAEDGSWSLTHYYSGLMAGDFQISQPQNYVIMRYADVLLMAAELGSPKAQSYFNQVRERAFTTDDDELSTSYTQKTATLANIMDERHKEFAFEGIRYWDLRRQDTTAATLANAIVSSGGTVESGGVEETVTYNAENITSKRGFLQIPLTQIQLSNNVLVQNAGW